MKIQFASDLHLEFKDNYNYLMEHPLIPVAPYLILAGDIDNIRNRTVSRPLFFKYLSENWKEVYIIPGNHEFYGGGDMSKSFDLEIKIHDNVQYLNHQVVLVEGVELIFTTLWSKNESHLIEKLISDFRSCLFNCKKLTSDIHDKLHEQAVLWLSEQLNKPKIHPRIVISHFVPCNAIDGYPKNNSDFQQQIISKYFVAELDEQIKNWDIDYWVYGHNHFDMEGEFYDVKFRSNQFGYSFKMEHTNFDYQKVIEI